eukprot:GEMP01047697.1.p1 GENE.GEMP01047697.1~~GEMP01047697.1.p1  ORF type:complete len:220 (+),score=41.16 GEMP01047697.1:92-751(+)
MSELETAVSPGKRRRMVAQPHVKQINQHGHACEVQSGVRGVNWHKRSRVWEAKLQIGNRKSKGMYEMLSKRFNPIYFLNREDESPLDPGPMSRAKDAAVVQRREWEGKYSGLTVKSLAPKEKSSDEPRLPVRAASFQSGVTGVSWDKNRENWKVVFRPKNGKILRKVFCPKKHVRDGDASHLDPDPMNLAKEEAIKQRREWEIQYPALEMASPLPICEG